MDYASPGSYAHKLTPKEIENDRFAQRISTFLYEARKDNQFQGLILVAAPRFRGEVKKHFSEPLQ